MGMIVTFLTEAEPLVFLTVVLVLSILAVSAGYLWTTRTRVAASDRDEAAFGLGQAAIFGLIALILAFSFSFAADRFEARRAIVVEESIAAGDAYDYADFLPASQRDAVRALVRTYTHARLEAYESIEGSTAVTAAAGPTYERLWELVSADARARPNDLGLHALAQSVNEMDDRAKEQTAALNNHVPLAILGIVLFATMLGAALLGITFGRVRAPNRALSAIFCLLFAATVYAIVDLDHPRGGFIHVDLAPLQATYQSMSSH